jgi:regulator of nucleoside diphosphate kinase
MRAIYITEVDLGRSRNLVGVACSSCELDQAGPPALQAELDRAPIVSAHAVPSEGITMHSEVRNRDITTSEEMVFTLVYPRGANLEQGKISVMSSLGTALLGYRAGDVLDWRVPDGVRRVKVVGFVPDAAGHFHP